MNCFCGFQEMISNDKMRFNCKVECINNQCKNLNILHQPIQVLGSNTETLKYLEVSLHFLSKSLNSS